MIQHETTIHLNRPVEQVFAFLVDTGNLPKWQSNLVNFESLTDGPIRVGSRFREVRRMGRRQAESQAEITALEENRRLATRTVTKPDVNVTYSLQPENGGTRLKQEFVMRTNGLMRLLQPLIAGAIKKESASDFETLKRILES